ncbi:MAG: NUDIX hydrolase [Oscillospiraceae bacterium]|nr:NUDIX hydrolase [Oscillospiraceae bacterium]
MAVGTYYRNDPKAPRPNSPTRIGTNVLLEWEGKLLLEQRWDCGFWGLPGGRLRKGEDYAVGISRELREEAGIFLPPNAFRQIKVCDDDRIAAYADGTVWRMIIVLFHAVLTAEPRLKSSKESQSLRFFSKEELDGITIVTTHEDLVEYWKQLAE